MQISLYVLTIFTGGRSCASCCTNTHWRRTLTLTAFAIYGTYTPVVFIVCYQMSTLLTSSTCNFFIIVGCKNMMKINICSHIKTIGSSICNSVPTSFKRGVLNIVHFDLCCIRNSDVCHLAGDGKDYKTTLIMSSTCKFYGIQ